MRKDNNLHCDSCDNLLDEGLEGIYFEDRKEKREICLSCFEKEASDEEKNFNLVTDEEIEEWANGGFSDYTKSYLKDILNGVYALEEAKKDVLSFKRYKKV